MSRAILTAIRRLPQLKGALKLTALELAHMASGSGTISVPYAWLARKTGLSVRTTQRHIAKLIDLHIVAKTCVRLALNRWGTNRYTFLVRAAPHLHKCASDIVSQLSSIAENSEKSCTLSEDIQRWEKALRFATPGSDAYATTWAILERLRELLRPPEEVGYRDAEYFRSVDALS